MVAALWVKLTPLRQRRRKCTLVSGASRVTLRPLVLFLAAVTGVFGQDVFPGVFGKITSRPAAGNLAPEVTFAKVLHSAGTEPWTAANLSGRITVLFPFPRFREFEFGEPMEHAGGTVHWEAGTVRVDRGGKRIHPAAIS